MRPPTGPLVPDDDLTRAAVLLAERDSDAVTVARGKDDLEVVDIFSRHDLIVAYGRHMERLKHDAEEPAGRMSDPAGARALDVPSLGATGPGISRQLRSTAGGWRYTPAPVRDAGRRWGARVVVAHPGDVMQDNGETDNSPSEAFTMDSAARAVPEVTNSAVQEIGGFRILGMLGEGGMGIVYEAEQQNPHRRVALKVVRGGQFSTRLRSGMFRREAETLARLAHPNIAAHLRGGPHRGRPALLHDGAGRRGGRSSAFVRERLGGAAARRPSSCGSGCASSRRSAAP